MTPEPTETHPQANIRRCLDVLAELFPGYADNTPGVDREWKEEFAGRPADLCIEAIRRCFRTVSSAYLKMAEYQQAIREVLAERSPAGATPYDRSVEMRRQWDVMMAQAQAERAEALAFCRSLPDAELDELHRAALVWRGWDGAAAEIMMRKKDPRTSYGRACLVWSYHQQRMAVA